MVKSSKVGSSEGRSGPTAKIFNGGFLSYRNLYCFIFALNNK